MHKYGNYGTWNDCSEFWNSSVENEIINITNKKTNTKTNFKYKIPKKLIINNINDNIINYGKRKNKTK